jgi:hypothetical protein
MHAAETEEIVPTQQEGEAAAHLFQADVYGIEKNKI